MFEVGKTYKTRDGRNATILTVTRRHISHPIVALLETKYTSMHIIDAPMCYRANGLYVDGEEYSCDLMPNTVSMDKKYKTKCGYRVKILHTNYKSTTDSDCTVVVLIETDHGFQFIRIVKEDGTYPYDDLLSLVEVEE